MENGRISDGQITASSQYNEGHRAAKGRLNSMATPGAWVSGANNLNQWLQVDFQRCTIITGISTQGRRDYTQYVKTYTISSSDGENKFHAYKVDGIVKVRYYCKHRGSGL